MVSQKDEDEKRDEVLRRMLKTKPKPHKPLRKQKKKNEPSARLPVKGRATQDG
jgi:hypothetical protein